MAGWWFQTWLLLSISYMGCHSSHWRTPIFQDGYCITNQTVLAILSCGNPHVWKQQSQRRAIVATARLPNLYLLYIPSENQRWLAVRFIAGNYFFKFQPIMFDCRRVCCGLICHLNTKFSSQAVAICQTVWGALKIFEVGRNLTCTPNPWF